MNKSQSYLVVDIELENINIPYLWDGILTPNSENDNWNTFKNEVNKYLSFIHYFQTFLIQKDLQNKIKTIDNFLTLSDSFFQSINDNIIDTENFIDYKNDYFQYINGEIEESELEYNDLEFIANDILSNKFKIRDNYVNFYKGYVQFINFDQPVEYCEKCKINHLSTNKESILSFPFDHYLDKNEMINDILIQIQKNKKFLLELTEEYNSTILHCIAYHIKKADYKSKKSRPNIIYFLEFLSTRPEYTFLINHLNCVGRTGGETFERVCQYKDHKDYYYILKLMGIDKKRIQKFNPQNLLQISQNTSYYHKIQDNLFSVIINRFNDVLKKCGDCKQPVYLVIDFPHISKILFVDPDKETILHMVKEIINKRDETNQICRKIGYGDKYSNLRHQFFIKYFTNLYQESLPEFKIFNKK